METNALLNLRPDDVPESFAVCFNDACPRREECLRRLAGEAMSQKYDRGETIYPCALKADGHCRQFLQKRVIRAAWGFRTLFRKIRHEDYSTLRWRVMGLFGSESQFYRYNRGDYKLSPKLQDKVLDIFKRSGYDTTDFRFEHYEEMVDFIGD